MYPIEFNLPRDSICTRAQKTVVKGQKLEFGMIKHRIDLIAFKRLIF